MLAILVPKRRSFKRRAPEQNSPCTEESQVIFSDAGVALGS